MVAYGVLVVPSAFKSCSVFFVVLSFARLCYSFNKFLLIINRNNSHANENENSFCVELSTHKFRAYSKESQPAWSRRGKMEIAAWKQFFVFSNIRQWFHENDNDSLLDFLQHVDVDEGTRARWRYNDNLCHNFLLNLLGKLEKCQQTETKSCNFCVSSRNWWAIITNSSP